MDLFDDTIRQLFAFLEEKQCDGVLRTAKADNGNWPLRKGGSVVLSSDMGVELGNPRDESASFMVWTRKSEIVHDGRVHIIGPDIPESMDRSLPFGKAVILSVNGMTSENCYARHREMELARYDLKLDGYMMRAVSQYLREWSRVSREAVERGFSFSSLAGALSVLYKQIGFVDGVEFIFVTSPAADVRRLGETGKRVERLIGAMNKMAAEMSFDCGSCDYNDVCTEVEGLRDMRKTYTGGRAGGH